MKIIPETKLSRLRAVCEPDWGIVEVKRVGQDYDLEVAPKQDIEVKPFDFDVKISGITEKGEQLPPKKIKVRGEVVEPVRCIPVQLSFGPRRLDEKVVDVITLASANDEPFEIIGIEASPQEIGRASCRERV